MEDKLKKILSAILEIDKTEINKNTSADNIENWDSLKQMNIIVSIEEEFEIQFDEDEAILSNNFQSLEKLIKQKIN